MLDVKSGSRGLLVPRSSHTHITSLQHPANGLLFYDTTSNAFSYYSSSSGKWLNLINDSSDGLALPFVAFPDAEATDFRLLNSSYHSMAAELLNGNVANDNYTLKVTSFGKKSAGYFSVNSDINAISTLGGIGINTDSSSGRLHILGGSVQLSPEIMIDNNGGTGTDTSHIVFKNYGAPYSWMLKSYNNGLSSLERFNFYNSRSGNIMSLTGDGKVGIGTGNAAPNAKVQINATSNIVNPQLLLYNNGDDYARLSFQNTNGSSYWSIAGYNSTQGTDELNFFSSKSTAGNVMSVTSDNKVGINTAQPVEALDVNGNINVQGGINIIGPLKVSTNPGGTGQVLTSNGPGLKPVWRSLGVTYNGTIIKGSLFHTFPAVFSLPDENVMDITDLDPGITIQSPSKVIISGVFTAFNNDVVLGSDADVTVQALIAGTYQEFEVAVPTNKKRSITINLSVDVQPGPFAVLMRIGKKGGQQIDILADQVTYQVISQ